MTFRPYLGLFSLVPSLWLGGCALRHPVASIKQAVGAQPAIELQGTVAQDANADSVVPFDIVVVQDKSAAKQIAKMDASDWFGKKGRCTFVGGKSPKVQFHSWEFVPNQSFQLRVPIPAGSRAVYGFAQYAASGPHRIELSTSGDQRFELAKDGVHRIDQKPNIPPDATFADEKQKVCPDQ